MSSVNLVVTALLCSCSAMAVALGTCVSPVLKEKLRDPVAQCSGVQPKSFRALTPVLCWSGKLMISGCAVCGA
jgi:hypothetical protein